VKHIALLAVAASLLLGCSGDDSGGPNPPPPPPPSAVTVAAAGPPPAFLPATITVAAGGTVTFNNTSPVGTHNIKSATNAWPLVTVEPGESVVITAPAAGQYPFSCTIHAGMNGTLTVK